MYKPPSTDRVIVWIFVYDTKTNDKLLVEVFPDLVRYEQITLVPRSPVIKSEHCTVAFFVSNKFLGFILLFIEWKSVSPLSEANCITILMKNELSIGPGTRKSSKIATWQQFNQIK